MTSGYYDQQSSRLPPSMFITIDKLLRTDCAASLRNDRSFTSAPLRPKQFAAETGIAGPGCQLRTRADIEASPTGLFGRRRLRLLPHPRCAAASPRAVPIRRHSAGLPRPAQSAAAASQSVAAASWLRLATAPGPASGLRPRLVGELRRRILRFVGELNLRFVGDWAPIRLGGFRASRPQPPTRRLPPKRQLRRRARARAPARRKIRPRRRPTEPRTPGNGPRPATLHRFPRTDVLSRRIRILRARAGCSARERDCRGAGRFRGRERLLLPSGTRNFTAPSCCAPRRPRLVLADSESLPARSHAFRRSISAPVSVWANMENLKFLPRHWGWPGAGRWMLSRLGSLPVWVTGMVQANDR